MGVSQKIRQCLPGPHDASWQQSSGCENKKKKKKKKALLNIDSKQQPEQGGDVRSRLHALYFPTIQNVGFLLPPLHSTPLQRPREREGEIQLRKKNLCG